MEHADENNAVPWEDDWELAEEFCKSEYCSWAINCPFSWLDFKGYMPCYDFSGRNTSQMLAKIINSLPVVLYPIYTVLLFPDSTHDAPLGGLGTPIALHIPMNR